jgi:hypothetical protein
MRPGGFEPPTRRLVPDNSIVAMTVADVTGVKLAGLMFDAGPVNSPVLLQVGTPHAHKSNPADPTLLSDVFFRIGGATMGKATAKGVYNYFILFIEPNYDFCDFKYRKDSHHIPDNLRERGPSPWNPFVHNHPSKEVKVH